MGQNNESARCYILQDENATEKLERHHFDADYWRDKSEFAVIDGGRGGSVKADLKGEPIILRQYLRGGMIASLSKDRYIWLGKSSSRPWREWYLLKEARAAGLPVAKPLGACVWKSGLFYRAAIMTAYLEGTETLADYLSHSVLDQFHWHQLGLLIRDLQCKGFRHADLNANNILIDLSSKFHIIDFDKGRKMKKLDNWQWSALYRLQRSLVKIDKQNNLHYREDDWQALMDGYQSGL